MEVKHENRYQENNNEKDKERDKEKAKDETKDKVRDTCGQKNEYDIEYTVEELLPIVAELAAKSTRGESTSISYEKAEQLMEAVLYCIQEVKQMETYALLSKEGLSAKQSYEMGLRCVERKTKRALNLYNAMLPDFHFYENRCLYETFIKGLPEFFKWYDVKFAPQNTILMLDYPILKNLSEYTGIDKVYEFIKCIRLEQMFLSLFSEEYVLHVLSKYDPFYKGMIDNICEIVFRTVLVHMLLKKPFLEQDVTDADCIMLQKILLENSLEDIKKYLTDATEQFVTQYTKEREKSETHIESSEYQALFEYLSGSIEGIVCRIKLDN